MPKTLSANPNRLVAVVGAAVATVALATGTPPAYAGSAPPSPPLPVAGATIVVGGTSSPSLTPDVMAGFANTFSGTLINVGYPAQLWPFTTGVTLGESVATGAAALASVIAAGLNVAETMVVWGISQGALVVAAGLDVLAATVDPSRLTLVRVADPATPVTGILNAVPREVLSVLRWRPPPAAAAFNEIVVVNQYDGFAHWPLRPDPAAILNALAGAWYRHAQTAYVDLADVPTGNVTVETRANGTTATTYLMPATHLPLTQPLRDIGVPASYVDALDATLRPVIDAAYQPLPVAAPLQRRDPAAHQDQRVASAHRGRTAGRAEAAAPPRPERGHRAARSSARP